MLDIGFPEMLLVALVILLVFGPERLPEVLRTVGGWVGRARRSFTALKSEIEREIGADEIRRELHNSSILEEARKVRDDIEKSGAGLRASRDEMDQMVRKRMQGLDALEQAVADALPKAATPPDPRDADGYGHDDSARREGEQEAEPDPADLAADVTERRTEDLVAARRTVVSPDLTGHEESAGEAAAVPRRPAAGSESGQ